VRGGGRGSVDGAGQAGTLQPIAPPPADDIRIVGASVRLCDYECVDIQPHADAEQGLGLANAVCAQFGHDCRRQGNGAGLTRFRFLVPYARLCPLGALHDSELPFIQIDGAPAKDCNLAATEAAKDGQHCGNVHP